MLKKAAQCLGLASLLLLENYVDLLGGGPSVREHVPLPLAGICIAHILDILFVGLVAFAVLVPLRRTRVYPVVRILLVVGIPLYFLGREQALLPFSLPEQLVRTVYLLWPTVVLFVFLRFRTWFRRFIVLCRGLGIAAGIFAVCSILQLAWLTTWHPGQTTHTVAWATTPQPPRNHPRIVWIVFDELSYDQLFEHRAKDLPLPNFDRLRAISTLYTDVQPAGNRTAKIVPALLGTPPEDGTHPVDDTRVSMSNQLSLHFQGLKGWRKVDPEQSIFADARRAGFRTAAVGWYNPYCTLYAGAIDDCYWTNRDRLEGPMAQNQSILHNAATDIRMLERRAISPVNAAHDMCNYDVRTRLQTHLELQQHSLQVLQTDQADFVFLHLPIPHSPNIWSRIDDNYTQFCDSSYLDNLALADRVLGNILSTLQSSPRWSETSVIVQGDHSWRVNLWDSLPAWTDEDDQASHGVFDPRPALLIHQAGQSAPATNSTPWPLLQIHQTVEKLLLQH